MKKILFIDTRNTVRSQIAQAWFNHLSAGWGQAMSCGTMPANILDPRTVQVLREVGLNVASRIPQAVNQRDLANADMVVLMGKDVHAHVFRPTHIWDFQDLQGEPIEAIQELRDQIRVQISALIAEIRLQEMDALRTVGDWQIMMLCLQNS